MNTPARFALYKGYRFPPEIISHRVWIYYHFCLVFATSLSQSPLPRDGFAHEPLPATQQARQSAYGQLFKSRLSNADVEALRDATNKGWALGCDRFRHRITNFRGRRTAPLARGRPWRREHRKVSRKIEFDSILFFARRRKPAASTAYRGCRLSRPRRAHH